MDEKIKIIVFKLDHQEYGAEIQQVLSIERLQDIIELPQSPNFIQGVMNLRGNVTPVIDLKSRLNMKSTEVTEQTRVLIANINEIQIGFIVDVATDVIDIESSKIESTPKITRGDNSNFIKGVAKLSDRLLLLLDLEHVLDNQGLNEVKEVILK
ncbi:chemotaxis protein CheW [Aquibacillus halophilus]|uniref:Chemotaxis protein CheW n=1 Tax=Aquibacillus halophilus TaxID=930132 RepID=A0A6A8DEB1_9BACI|nr:chemotaxis protein CheW [Aquibacillus halophilus]MRH42111.1 chemotaxis protein CheW [Aquibacillus halophilus]